MTDQAGRDELKQLKNQYFGGSEAKYYRTELKRQCITDAEVRDELRSSLRLGRDLQEGDQQREGQPDAEVKAYYDAHRQVYTTPQTRVVRHILVKNKALADKLYAQLKGGEDFASLAKKYSLDPGSKAQGGRLTISRGQTVARVRQGRLLAPDGRSSSKPVHTAVRLAHHPGRQAGHTAPVDAVLTGEGGDPAAAAPAEAKHGAADLAERAEEGVRRRRSRTPPALRRPRPRRRQRRQGRPGRLPGNLQEALLDLQELTERLRRDCPWDREQTARTIVPHTVEEAYEVADAAFADDAPKLLDELGDLLFQVYILALLLSEQGQGDLRRSWPERSREAGQATPARLRRARGFHCRRGAPAVGADQA